MKDTYKFIIDKYKIDVGHQYLIDIPEMVGSVALSKLFCELDYKVGVEVGVDRGEYSEVLLKDNPNLRLYSVDPWSAGEYTPGMSGVNEKQAYFDGCYEETVKRLAPYNCEIVRKTSMEALKDFEDNSLDFVYIDANHDFLNFTMDLQGWMRKVKPGGIISGHDYAYFPYRKFNHVKRALIAYARCYRMIPVFAVKYQGNGLKRDRYRSWFHIKKASYV